jgi:hypothetical protein
MNREKFTKICAGAALILLVVPLVARFALIVMSSPSHLRAVVDLIFDDGYYYLAIAANFADTGRSTLDGTTLTNGYQPLWELVLTGLARIVGTQSWTLFVASCGLIVAIAIAGPLLALGWLRSPRRLVALAMATGLALIIVQQPELFLEGLEPVLFLLLAVPLAILEGPSNARQLRWLSLVLALAFLVRLDALALFLAAALLLPLWDAGWGRVNMASAAGNSLRMVLQLTLFIVPTVAIYLIVNQSVFGTAVPVSGIAKMIGGPRFSNWGIVPEFFAHWKSLLFLTAILVPLEVALRIAGRADRVFYRSMAMVTLAAAIQCFYYCAFSTWGIWPWYAYLVSLDMVLLAARIVYVAALLCDQPRLRLAAGAAVGLLGAWMFYRGVVLVERVRVPDASHESFNQLSLTMLDDFFSGTAHPVVAMGDRAGGLAYWGRSKLTLVQTEGLVLGMGYIRARIANQGAEYLQQHYPIDYWVVDRQVVPTVAGPDGVPLYVVADPIQGRITTAPVPTFCFPAPALRYDKEYATRFGVNRRMAFAFADRQPCPAAAVELVRAAATGIGLRRLSLPGEYSPSGAPL